MSSSPVIYWLRQDLRVSDNPALHHAVQQGRVLPVYILDDENAGECALGAASRAWLHRSLAVLKEQFDGHLSFYKGDPLSILPALCEQNGVEAVFWNRCYEPWQISRDGALKEILTQGGITVSSFNGSLLWEPWTISKKDGTPYRVFTPFYTKGCLATEPPRRPLEAPENANYGVPKDKGCTLDALSLLPDVKWDQAMLSDWSIGEKAAQVRLADFLDNGVMHYKKGRDHPSLPYVSRISPHLHFGELSPNQAWYAARALEESDQVDHFCRELGWREFSYSLLYYNKELPRKNLQSKFDAFPWDKNPDGLEAWKKGQTGIPLVDAGLRELWQTGYMHNRVRMVVGSFLVKNLLVDWREGERWFWDCLVDADLANNSAGWQWIAGCGADAAPYFRIFNPVMQAQKFDENGDYIRRYVPELADLQNKYLFSPWDAPKEALADADVVLGQTYPAPIVDLKKSRNRALEAYQTIKG
ncbi:cryptochrome/photolyase family protein [Sneathiella aquimaris]|uniref:cryptochrome/photolyase family protein n=1 Tax=Sneathiella aquimaris TaxID=2599305 RepID=UPI001469DD56|nr:deoxyribodipyrimidine photo-lyase [Sneathiella aquimaris]